MDAKLEKYKITNPSDAYKRGLGLVEAQGLYEAVKRRLETQ